MKVATPPAAKDTCVAVGAFIRGHLDIPAPSYREQPSPQTVVKGEFSQHPESTCDRSYSVEIEY